MNVGYSPVEIVLSRFGMPADQVAVRACGNAGGMSGAAIWQIHSASSVFCLRRWPTEHPSRAHLAWIHRQLRRAADGGCEFLPIPLRTPGGDTCVEHDGQLWELAPWMAGSADYHQRPSPARLAAALQALARLHLATSDPTEDPVAISPGLQQRWQQIRATTPAHLNRLERAVDGQHGPAIERLARDILRAVPAALQLAAPRVEAARDLCTPLQPCLRDIWHDHVLFEGERVSALIDFGAMRVDAPVGDVARLLGSLVGNAPEGWETGLRAYESLRTLTIAQRQMLAAFDAANRPLAGLNWVRWLFAEGRQFERLDRVEGRMAEIATALASRTLS